MHYDHNYNIKSDKDDAIIILSIVCIIFLYVFLIEYTSFADIRAQNIALKQTICDLKPNHYACTNLKRTMAEKEKENER